MPILLVFLLVGACLPIEWPEPPFEASRHVGVSLTAAAISLPLLAAFALRTWVVRTLRRQPDRRVEVGQVYSRVRRVLFFANVGAVATAILLLGWGWTVQQTLLVERQGRLILAPFAELAVPLPYFLIVFGCWLIYYDAERGLHRSLLLAPYGEFWSRAGYFLHHLRQLALLVVLPVGLFVTQQSLIRMWPETAREDWYRVGTLALVPVLILLMPLLIKPLLGLRPLPAGPVRGRIESLARRLNFRYTDLLVWPTRGAVANAMIVGLIPRVRYVIFTDRILDEMPPDELDGVFGHEVGHARHGHIWFYAAFLGLSMAVIAALFLLLAQTLDEAGVTIPEEYLRWLSLPPLVVAAGYVFLVFGFLSRRCERQADVFGCRAVSCADPNCAGHTTEVVYPANAAGLCPTGIRTFSRALERVGLLNGYGGPDPDHSQRTVGGLVRSVLGWLRAWQHSTMPRRVAFLLSLIDDPRRERRFQRRVTLLRWGLAVGLLAALLALGELVGWRNLLDAM
jgi:Zn-dependent protease with chaperone function